MSVLPTMIFDAFQTLMMAGKISSTWKAVKFILIVRSSFDRVICFSRFLKYYFVRKRTSVFPFLFSRGSFFLLIITKRNQGLIIVRSFWRHLENRSPRTKEVNKYPDVLSPSWKTASRIQYRAQVFAESVYQEITRSTRRSITKVRQNREMAHVS